MLVRRLISLRSLAILPYLEEPKNCSGVSKITPCSAVGANKSSVVVSTPFAAKSPMSSSDAWFCARLFCSASMRLLSCLSCCCCSSDNPRRGTFAPTLTSLPGAIPTKASSSPCVSLMARSSTRWLYSRSVPSSDARSSPKSNCCIRASSLAVLS